MLSNIKISRYVPFLGNMTAQLLGFSDTSEKGYAAVIYLCVMSSDQTISVQFITAKSKVAPLKLGYMDPFLSILRLKLYGALLLAQTMIALHHSECID